MQLEVDPALLKETVVRLRKEAQKSLQFEELVTDYQSLITHREKLEQTNSELDQQTQQLTDENNWLKADLWKAKQGAQQGYIAEQFEQQSVQLAEQRTTTLQKHAEVLQQLVRCRQRIEVKQKEKDELADELEQQYSQNDVLRKQVEQVKQQLSEKSSRRHVNSKKLQDYIKQQETAEQWVEDLNMQKGRLERQMVEMMDTIAQKRSTLNEELDNVWSMQVELQSMRRSNEGKKLVPGKIRIPKFISSS